jgi:hypothetical protein
MTNEGLPEEPAMLTTRSACRRQRTALRKGMGLAWLALALVLPAAAAVTQPRYYAHPAVEDAQGVIAPWYSGQNGQLDLRVRIAAETMKRYPWTDSTRAVAALPEYLFSSLWRIDPAGTISVPRIDDWMNGDLGQRAAYVLSGWVDYYAYSGDPAAIAHLTWQADLLLDYCQTGPDHAWPRFLISVPTKGKPYGACDPHGFIQLDIVAECGLALLRAYQLTGNRRWFEAVAHWGDVLAEKRSRVPGAAPWGRYANPEDTPWKDNTQTGGVVFLLCLFDELIRLGHTGPDDAIVAAREAGQAYLDDVLLPQWLGADTWGRNYWDWVNNVQAENVTEFACRYLLDNPARFPNWRCDVRNTLSLFLNNTSVSEASCGDVYSGAWAFPESSSCCGRSLWYGPLELAMVFAQYGVQAGSEWARDIARRMVILATYDIHETGVSEDNIDGGTIVNGDWFKIAHPMALKHVLRAIAWQPEWFAPARENHLVRSTEVVSAVTYGKGRVEYTTFAALPGTTTVLRLAFVPTAITADGIVLTPGAADGAVGYAVRPLDHGDCIVTVRHADHRRVVLTGEDLQQVAEETSAVCRGEWQSQPDPQASGGALLVSSQAGAAAAWTFAGNQVRLIGRVDPHGGLADVLLDGEPQRAGIDCWNPSPRQQHVLYYRNGLAPGRHTLEIVARGTANPYSAGTALYLDALQWSAATGAAATGEGGGPRDAQRLLCGYPARTDYRDSAGNTWRPATEFTVRCGHGTLAASASWWTEPATAEIASTPDPELYRYGIHAPEFAVIVTVGPGRYHLRLGFAAARGEATAGSCTNIDINGRRVVSHLDVEATAGGPNRAVDLVFEGIEPDHGVIEIRFTGTRIEQGEAAVETEAFVQAIAIGPGPGGQGASPVASRVPLAPPELLRNPGFERDAPCGLGAAGHTLSGQGWTAQFLSPTQSYVWRESDYSRHPDWGLPEFRSGKQAIRTHSDGQGHTRIFQQAGIEPGKAYVAAVWVRAADLHGRGFGQDGADSAGLIIEELGATGEVLRQHPKAEVKDAGPFRRLEVRFTTGAAAAAIRFVLDTVIACPYNEGHITYDDCTLAPAGP